MRSAKNFRCFAPLSSDFCSSGLAASFFRAWPAACRPATSFSSARTDNPCATTRAASKSRLCGSTPSSTFACPADSAPSESARLIASDRSSSRSAFATVARALPIRFEISSCVSPASRIRSR